MTAVLAFDTETTGLVVDAPPDHPAQPHLVQFGAVLIDDQTLVEMASLSLLIQPAGWAIPPGAEAVHGISTAMAAEFGVPLIVACGMFSNLAKLAQRHIAHNAAFDLLVMQAAFHRVARPFPAMNIVCTKEMADPVLCLPPTARMIAAGYGDKFKAPSLAECIRFLFEEEMAGAHSALADCRYCARVFFELCTEPATAPL